MSSQRGMRTFAIIWSGQAVSMLGTAMTRFALLIWAYDRTGRATTLALLGFFSFAVYVTIVPFAGIWVDRWDRRRVMIAADLGTGLVTLGLLAQHSAGHLQTWHLYAGGALSGLFEAFQHPAYNASVSILVPPHQLTRCNGLRTLSYDATNILGPLFAGLLLRWSGLSSIMVLDIGTVGIAALTLCIVRIPRPAVSAEGLQTRGSSFWGELTFGTRYIRRNPGLLGLTIIFMLIHLFAALAYFGLLPAMVLARSGGDELALSAVQSALGVGGVVGGIVLAIWGGPRRKIHGVLGYCAASFLLGDLLFATGRTPAVWVVAGFNAAFFIPFIGSANSTIWQSKVPLDVQGRVLGTAFALQQITRPVGYLLAGPLADRVFEPAMMPGGVLSDILGGVVGQGPGAGMGLMFLGMAILGALTCLGGYLFPALRNVETTMPDREPAVDAGRVAGPAAAD